MVAGALREKQGHGTHAAVQQRLILWVRWLLADFVVPLLRAPLLLHRVRGLPAGGLLLQVLRLGLQLITLCEQTPLR